MTPLLIVLALGPAQAASAAPPQAPAPVAATATSPADLALVRVQRRELLPLGVSGAITVETEALAQRVVVRHKRAGAMLSALRLFPSEICPDVTASKGTLTFTCETSRLEANLTYRNGAAHLELLHTAGPPQTGEDAALPRFGYPPQAVALGNACPGTTEAGRGECAFAAGDDARATTVLHAALNTIERNHAALRLGDLARFRGDYRGALRFYNQAGRKGPWGRLALIRICEMRGTCEEVGRYAPGFRTFDAAALPTPIRTEVLLRTARYRAFNDDAAGAIDFLLREADTTPGRHTCEAAPTLCERITVRAFAEDSETVQRRTLAFYMTLPAHDGNPVAVKAALLAAEVAGRIGAPGYGAALLAGVSAKVPDAQRRAHLYRATTLYLDAGDTERARMVLAYAETLPAHRGAATEHKALSNRLSPPVKKAEAPGPEIAKARTLLESLKNRSAEAAEATVADTSAP